MKNLVSLHFAMFCLHFPSSLFPFPSTLLPSPRFMTLFRLQTYAAEEEGGRGKCRSGGASRKGRNAAIDN